MTKYPINNLLKKHIKKTSSVIIGVSGGADSVFLLDKCIKLQKTHPFKIIVAHINHNLRGQDSNKDEEFVRRLAKKYKCQFETIQIHPKKQLKGNLEENCRDARYRFFEKLRKKHKANQILTAHHLNDNIETILLNIVRGSFVDGMSGMTIVDKKRYLFRPLLFTTRDEILIELKKRRITFKVDKTNDDTKLSRNLMRHKVIPSLKTINNNLEQTFAKNIPNFQALQSFLQKNTNDWLKKHSNKDGVNLINFLELEPIIQKNTLFYMYKQIYGNTKNLSQNHLEQILKIIEQNQANRKKEFGNTHFIAISRSKTNNNKYIQILKK